MLSRYSRAFLFLAALMAVLACVTINVYFPEAAIQDLSEQIEEAIARRAAEAAAEEPPEDGGGAAPEGGSPIAAAARTALTQLLGAALAALGPAPAYAQPDEVAAPEISNPAIQRIIQSRAARVGQLNRLKAAGVVGESNQALVEVRDLGALGLQERAEAQKLTRDENADRERMFKEIAAATGTDLSQLPRIRETYAQTLRDKARRGDWIQMPNGSWQQKP